MKLITQPEDGIAPLLRGIKAAKRTVDIVIFRFDLTELEDELEAAVKRGVVVRALVAHTNKGGASGLRKLEQKMLGRGITVCRTDDDMVRYHGKVMIVDGKEGYILGFNFTAQDLKSRSFGVIVKTRKIVKELLRLFESDANRTAFKPHAEDLFISPYNARPRLLAFLRKARTSIDIYDPQVSDDEMLAVLAKKAESGVRVRILGTLEKKWGASGIAAEPFPGKRLHVRAIVRDGRRAFVGSQSLRKLELDERREVGVALRDRDVVEHVARVFKADWKLTASGQAKTESKKEKEKDKKGKNKEEKSGKKEKKEKKQAKKQAKKEKREKG
jgi:phosphatidylserine/phosphatidylglycerophosphate/cardiolipin synthase-like enzyme